MCLKSKWIFPRIATKDIVCYKILIKYDNGHLKTPYQNFPISTIKKLPITVKSGKHKSIKQYIKNIKYLYEYSENNIIYSIIAGFKRKEGGYIHAFNKLYDAKWVAELSRPYFGNNIIVKCIIPKGTPYHISSDEIEICARKMKILEIIQYE